MKEYIERQAAIDVCWGEHKKCVYHPYDNAGASIAWTIRDGIMELPAADVRPVIHATWEEGSGDWLPGTDATKDYKCSNCKSEFVEDGKYCPECGATMRKEE